MGIIIAGLIAWLAWELVFYFTHNGPLTEKEIKQLANKRKRKYIKQKYVFTAKEVGVNQKFKSSLKPTGRFYKVDEALSEIPSLIGALLKSKKHEWIVHAIEQNARIIYLWANKGWDNQSASDYLGLDALVTICKEVGGHSILMFHNHPNSDPQRYNCLLPSDTDKRTATKYGEQMSSAGINHFAFVCERGRFLIYYKNISPLFYPDVANIENIVKENGVSKNQNYKLHRELGLLIRRHRP